MYKGWRMGEFEPGRPEVCPMSYTLGYSPVVVKAFHSYLRSRLLLRCDILHHQKRKNWG